MNAGRVIAAAVAAFVVSILIAVFNTGCNGCRNNWSHIKSETVGLNRTVTLYSNDGKVIKAWEITSAVEDQGGSFKFIMDSGKAVTISGTVVIEQK